jgi:hypothetical protein
MKRLLAAIVAAGACAAAAQAYAHHSFPEIYLEDRTVTIQGELAGIVLRNPHSFVHVVVKERDGSLIRYAVEWVGVTELGGQGVTRESLKLGDYVIVHELLHFSVPNHGKLWKSLMRAHLGNYERQETRLRQISK